jgi:hypothetical protein
LIGRKIVNGKYRWQTDAGHDALLARKSVTLGHGGHKRVGALRVVFVKNTVHPLGQFGAQERALREELKQ